MDVKPWEHKPELEEIEQELSSIVNRELDKEYGEAEQKLETVNCMLDMAKEQAKGLNKNDRVMMDIRNIEKEIMSHYKQIIGQKEVFHDLFSVKREAFAVKKKFDNDVCEINKAAKEVSDKAEAVSTCYSVVEKEIARSEIRIAEEQLDKKIKSFVPIGEAIESHGRKLVRRDFYGISEREKIGLYRRCSAVSCEAIIKSCMKGYDLRG